MKKQISKTKITKQKKKQQKRLNGNIYFEVILMIILIPLFSFFVLSVFGTNKIYKEHYLKDSKDVKILTDKNIYNLNDEIVLIVKNNSGEPVYFEPCEYLNNFEKKINGKWVAENKIISNKIYDEHAFDKKNSVIKCEIDLPQSGKGVYRTVVNVYYNCGKPGYDTCRSFETFYSNEFEVEERIKN
ncbi:hypothetical protein KAT63_00735 [Candidatus Parcubacteria bacterium]|nr:hypothetical protein [Candidatus Parcubacteria bacterium]